MAQSLLRGALALVLAGCIPTSMEKEDRQRPALVILSWFPAKHYALQLQAIRERLALQGMRQGADFDFEYHVVRSQQVLDEIILGHAGRPFVLYSNTTSPAELVIKNGTRAPHVFATYSDPLAAGWIESYARPGGTATGIVEYADAHVKRLELLARLVPKASRFAMVVGTGTIHPDLAGAMRAFTQGGRVVELVNVAEGDDADTVARRLRSARAEAAYVPLPVGGSIDTLLPSIYSALDREAVPTMSERFADVRRGAVLALEVDRSDLRARVAHTLGLVMRGTPPGSIPVHSPRRFLLTVNLDAAQRLGLAVPPSLMRQANLTIADGK